MGGCRASLLGRQGGGDVWDGACAQVGLLSLAGSQEDAEGNISVAVCV